jgi:hypothetical protein
LRWLQAPQRAKRAQLEEIARQAPTVPPRTETVHAEVAIDGFAPAEDDVLRPPRPVAGWGAWPPCKRAKYIAGVEQEGERHWTWLLLGAEAVLHADFTEDELAALQLAVPLNDNSNSSEAELHADAKQNAKDLLRRKAEGNPILTGCPGRLDARSKRFALREVFAHHCTDARFAACPVGKARWAMQTPYREMLGSSIWRSLGLPARLIYEMAVERAERAGPTLQLSSRYVAVRLPFVGKGSADEALRRLTRYGLLLHEKHGSGLYTLPPPLDRDALLALEDKFGTADLYRKETERARSDWDEQRRQRRDYAITKDLEEQLRVDEAETLVDEPPRGGSPDTD